MDELLQTDRQWAPLYSTVRSVPGARSAAALDAVVDELHVETSARYRARDGLTFCNIYAQDAARAMGVVLPHWVDAAGADTLPGSYTDSAGHRARWELGANELGGQWLPGVGIHHGWSRTTAEAAQQSAEGGRFAVAVWGNPTGRPGHIAVFVPAHGAAGPVISQAGARNFRRGSLVDGFGSHAGEAHFWAHE